MLAGPASADAASWYAYSQQLNLPKPKRSHKSPRAAAWGTWCGARCLRVGRAARAGRARRDPSDPIRRVRSVRGGSPARLGVFRMSQTTKRHLMTDAERYQAVTAARERFLAGDDRVRGVRPEVATSWYRCREQYHVDPGLSVAPPASAQDESSAEHTLEHEIVFAQLGGAAASIASEVESVGGVVTVTDGAGSDPDRPGRQGDARPRARQQHGAVVVLVGMGDGHERHGHGARGARTGADQRARALVHGLRRVGLRRRGGSRPRDARSRRGPRRLGLARQPSAASRRVAVQGGRAARARILRQRARDSGAELAAAFAQTRARRPDSRSPPWTRAARSSSPTRRPASSSASPRACRRSTPRSAGNRA